MGTSADVPDQAGERRKKAGGIFAVQHAEHQANGLGRALLEFPQRLCDGRAAGRIVSAVEP